MIDRLPLPSKIGLLAFLAGAATILLLESSPL